MDASLAARSAITSRLSAIDTTRDPAASAANANLMSRRISCSRFAKPFNSYMMAISAVTVDATEPTMHRGRSPNTAFCAGTGVRVYSVGKHNLVRVIAMKEDQSA